MHQFKITSWNIFLPSRMRTDFYESRHTNCVMNRGGCKGGLGGRGPPFKVCPLYFQNEVHHAEF